MINETITTTVEEDQGDDGMRILRSEQAIPMYEHHAVGGE
jgi:hypothetical protein